MVKHFLSIVLLLSLLVPLTAQQEFEVGEAFGIDILPVMISLGGGLNAFDELELLYRVNNEKGKQLRLKMSLNNRAVITEEIVFAKALGGSCSEQVPWLINKYVPSQNFHFAAGVASYLSNSPFPLYYGLDVNFGVFRGQVETYRERCDQQVHLVSDLINSESAFSYVAGITPVLGTELSLNKLRLVIEFGFTANYNFGKHPYIDEEEQKHEKKIGRTDLLLNKFLNDLAIVYRF